MRVSTALLYQQGLSGMLDQQSALAKTQKQLSSGLRITSPADDPAASARLVGLGQSDSQNQQYQNNAKVAESRLNLEDTTLGSVTGILQRVRALAVQGLNGTQSSSDRQAIATEVRQLKGQLTSLANTQDANGEYLFAGYKSQTRPFTASGGTVSFAGDQGQRVLQIGPSQQVAVGDSGQNVFMQVPDKATGSGYQSVFATVENLIQGLQSNAPNSNVLSNIDAAIGNVSDTRARVGARLNILDRQKQVNSAVHLQISTTRSQLQDLDYAKATSRLQQQLLGLQAAQQSFVKLEGLSLFKYL